VTINDGEEDILGVLLPREKRVIEENEDEGPVPKIQRTETRVEHGEAPRKEARSPAPSTSSSSSSEDSTIPAAKWEEIGMKMVAQIGEAVQQNTRAIRCMGRTLEELTKAVEVIARSGKAVQELMEEAARSRRKEEEERRRRETESKDKENRDLERVRGNDRETQKEREE
jgi:hypothetical protein